MVLAGEVAVDGAHGHVGPGGHVAHLHRLVPAFEAERHGGVDDTLAPGLLGPGERTGERLLHSDMLSGTATWGFWTRPLRWATMAARASVARKPQIVDLERLAEPRGRRPTAGCRASAAARPVNACSTHGRTALHDIVALGQGHGHRPTGQHLAGHLLPVLRQRRGGHPGPGRGHGRRGRPVGRARGGDWSEETSWETALTVTEGFLAYWEDNRAVFRVVDLATEEGDVSSAGIRVRALNAVTVALSQVILQASSVDRESPPAVHRVAGRQ